MDKTSDMLTIIRNAQRVKHASVKSPYSRVNFGIAEILKKEGWIKDIELRKRGERSWIILGLSYNKDGTPVIQDIQKVSKPGKRIYVGSKKMPVVRQGYGLAVVSTPKGIMTGKEAKKQGVGGEILCRVW